MKNILFLTIFLGLFSFHISATELSHRVRFKIGPSFSTELRSIDATGATEKSKFSFSAGLAYAYKNYGIGWGKTGFAGVFKETSRSSFFSTSRTTYKITGNVDSLELFYMHFFPSTPLKLSGGIGAPVRGEAKVKIKDKGSFGTERYQRLYTNLNGNSIFFGGGYDWKIGGQTLDLFANLQSNYWNFIKTKEMLNVGVISINMGIGYVW